MRRTGRRRRHPAAAGGLHVWPHTDNGVERPEA
jgi:hypothetical protein